jgi:glucose-1-phosphate cytidylyltransferase
MTGGRLKRVLGFIEEEEFLLTYGDGVSNVDVNAAIAHHRNTQATVTLTAVSLSARFGELEISEGLVHSFQEKPKESQAMINGGFLVMNKSIATLLPNDDCVLEQVPLTTLSKQGKLAAYKHSGFWQCMDNIREMALLNELWASGNAPWKTW